MDRKALLTEIAVALGNRSINIDEIIHINKALAVLQEVGVQVIGNVIKEPEVSLAWKQVAQQTGLSLRSLKEFVEANPFKYGDDGRWWSNKIKIIISLRKFHPTPLVTAKWAVEMLYLGSSETTP